MKSGFQPQALNGNKVKVAQYCSTNCNPMDYTVHEIIQVRILEWIAFPFSRESSQPRDRTQVSHTAGRFLTIGATREALMTIKPWTNHQISKSLLLPVR